MKTKLLYYLIRHSGAPLLLPFYHAIADKPLPHIQKLYSLKTSNQFESELQTLLEFYEPIGLHELMKHVAEKKKIRKPSFFLSFDDGLSSCYEMIFPLLEKYNIKAAFFVNNAFVDNKELFYRHKVSLILNEIEDKELTTFNTIQINNYTIHDVAAIDQVAEELQIDFQSYLLEEKPYMTRVQIEKLIEAGHYVGGHSVNHPYFPDIQLEEQLEQSTQSLDFVQEEFDLDYRIFAFPFTDFGVKKEYFTQLENVDLLFSVAGLEIDEFAWNLKRFDMEKNKDAVQDYLIQSYLKLLIKRMLNRGKIIHPSLA